MKSKDDYYEIIKMIPGPEAVPPLEGSACKMGDVA